MCEYICVCVHVLEVQGYGAATISRLLKIIVLFGKEPYKRDCILQKRPMILRSLLIVATRYLLSSDRSVCVCACVYMCVRLCVLELKVHFLSTDCYV